MTKFGYEAILPWDRDIIFKTFRDRLEEYGILAPNVVSVKVLKRRKVGKGKMRIQAKWQAKGDIPFVVRSILKPNMLAWKDDVIWDENTYRNDWEVESFFFNEFFACSGSWEFKRVGSQKTKVGLHGKLHIYISHMPPFPDRLVQGAGEVIEKFILRYLNPNLTQGVKAVRTLLAREMDE